MPMQNPAPWNSRKILLVPVFGCALAAILVAGGAVYWFTSPRAHRDRPVARAVAARHHDLPRVQQVAFAQDRNEGQRTDGKFANDPAVAKNETNSVAPTPRKVIKNAILGSVGDHATAH